jgi:hypothetical protein
MASRTVVATQQIPVLQEIRDIVAEFDPEAASQLTRFTPGGGVPNSLKQPVEYELYLSECLLILARKVQELDARTPKRRGRPPKRAKGDRQEGLA